VLTRIEIQNLAQIETANVELADLTLLVGPQATGKSIFLQTLKLGFDKGAVGYTLRKYGFEYGSNRESFAALYYGEGMEHVFRPGFSMRINGKETKAVPGQGQAAAEKVFYIPAQRVLTLIHGWFRPFGDYEPGDPFVLRDYSDKLRVLLGQGLGGKNGEFFPISGKLKEPLRQYIQRAIYPSARVSLDTQGMRKRVVLRLQDAVLPYMIWSAGQREFTPLLMGLYWLLPASKAPKKADTEWVIIEEPEMGLHPRAIIGVMLLVIELLSRGYKVVLSTHSSMVLDCIWGIRELKSAGAEPTDYAALFGVDQKLKGLLETCGKKDYAVYYFGDNGNGQVVVKDISELDPGAEDLIEAGWGGLSSFSANVANVVAAAHERRSQRALSH
jgi:energy-coupling factor transporter ATP-binding protein EcfA2